jgi:hypothetical protein
MEAEEDLLEDLLGNFEFMPRHKIKPQGFCVFGGRPGVSEEHVWPEWTHEFFLETPRQSADHHKRNANSLVISSCSG